MIWMGQHRFGLHGTLLFAAMVLVFGYAGMGTAHAVPAFSDQTGQPCSACHVGGFGPHLTPFGRAFKLGAYTLRTNDAAVPVSAMAVVSWLNTAKNQPTPPAPHYGTNDNFTLDQASIFLAGGIGHHVGGFVQTTYDGVGRAFAWDNLDIRAADSGMLAGQPVQFGVSLNNAPGVEDVWNTLPAWGYPFTDSDLALSPEESPLIGDALAQNVLGLNAYMWWNSEFYAEAGLYRSLGTGFLRTVGVDSDDTSQINGVAPYVRIAYAKDYGNWNFEAGAFGLFANLYPGRDKSTGKTDGYDDIGLDGSVQMLGDVNSYTFDARYTHERQSLDASVALHNAANVHNTLDDLRADATYHWKNTIGGTVSAFTTSGSHDSILYSGNRTLTPNSSGFIFQADWTPFGDDPEQRLALRVGAQYTVYTRFAGASTNYDNSGRNASDNNTFRLFAWVAY